MATVHSRGHRLCPWPSKPGSDFAAIAYGTVSPIIAFAVLLANCHGIAILAKLPKLTQTNILLLAIFTIDLLTSLAPLPGFLYLFAYNNNEPLLLPYPWCFVVTITNSVIPTITNSTSAWLIAVLILQRTVAIRSQALQERLFNRPCIGLLIVAATLTPTAAHSVRLIDIYRQPFDCFDGEQLTTTCSSKTTFSYVTKDAIYPVYYIIRISLFHVLPAFVIIASGFLLIMSFSSYTDDVARVERQENNYLTTKRTVFNNSSQMVLILAGFSLCNHMYQTLLLVANVAAVYFADSSSSLEPIFAILGTAAIAGNLAYLVGFLLPFFLCIFALAPFRDGFCSIYNIKVGVQPNERRQNIEDID